MPCTKIVATVGPASSSPEVLEALYNAGADVFRLNMSHGDHETHAESIRLIREIARRGGRPAGILCDLSGPKIRIGEIAPEPVQLSAGDEITITTRPVPQGNAQLVSCNYSDLPREVLPGQRVLLDDGLLEFEVRSVRPPDVHCTVVRGGPLSSNKGLNLPTTRLRISSLTQKDRADIEFGLTHDVDFFALSFVKRVQDIEEARYFIKFRGGSIPIIAKIEKGEAVENIEAILDAADGAMVARGDLGVEIPLEDVPLVQKRVIDLCNRLSKPVITATQMLDSMIRSARPTRAEVGDVANAILDGTDAVMLSGETASGQYPVEAVEMMARIARATEGTLNRQEFLRKKFVGPGYSIPDAISHAAASMAHDLSAARILCLTQGGSTPRRVASWRPQCAILAYCPLPRTAQQLSITWGVKAVTWETGPESDEEPPYGIEAEFDRAVRACKEQGLVRAGDRLIIAAGMPIHEPGTTNLVRVLDVS